MSHPHEPKKRPRASISSSLDNQSYNSHSASLSTPRPVPWPTPSHYVRTSLPLFSTSSPDALLSQSLRAVAIYHRRSAGGGSSSGGRVGSATPPLRGGLSGVPVRLSCAASLSHLLSLTPSPEVHSALALAIVRSVNLFTDAARRRSCLGGGGPAASEPVSALAERIGLPNYVVMVRHGCAHERTLPGYKVLKISAETILRWIREEEERKQLPQQHQKRDGRLDSAHRQPPSRHFHHLPQDYNDLLHFIEQQSKSLALVAEKEAKELVVEAVRKFPGLHVRFIVEATEALLDTLLLVPADANSNAGENFDADNKFVDEIIFSATKKKPILHGDAKATVNTDANANISVDTNSNANARASANANADANSNEDKVHEKGMPPAEKKNDTTAIKQTANVASRWIKYFLSTHFYTALLLPPSLEKKKNRL
uniref:Uncharacterized protein n=1 Tax=Corethron hystrix TaxID=216773 RepID=A0A7S1C0S9_9STRA|mmetsp:Transcript_9603/g.21322  ORF Transcript_9603/g.21322 Transcript_9603/m.21322 type:complete len:426 (+) Transcript_9603:46-1323(+)